MWEHLQNSEELSILSEVTGGLAGRKFLVLEAQSHMNSLGLLKFRFRAGSGFPCSSAVCPSLSGGSCIALAPGFQDYSSSSSGLLLLCCQPADKWGLFPPDPGPLTLSRWTSCHFSPLHRLFKETHPDFLPFFTPSLVIPTLQEIRVSTPMLLELSPGQRSQCLPHSMTQWPPFVLIRADSVAVNTLSSLPASLVSLLPLKFLLIGLNYHQFANDFPVHALSPPLSTLTFPAVN